MVNVQRLSSSEGECISRSLSLWLTFKTESYKMLDERCEELSVMLTKYWRQIISALRI